jgi:REP element-mobilizing transposase RayT
VSHTSGKIILHLVFSTVERRPLITAMFRDDLFAYLGGIVRGMRATALIVNGTADHVHMLVRIRPNQSAAELARVIKANSSAWFVRSGAPSLDGKPDTEHSASANRMSLPSQNISPTKKSTIRNIRFRRRKNNVSYDEKYIWG